MLFNHKFVAFRLIFEYSMCTMSHYTFTCEGFHLHCTGFKRSRCGPFRKERFRSFHSRSTARTYHFTSELPQVKVWSHT